MMIRRLLRRPLAVHRLLSTSTAVQSPPPTPTYDATFAQSLADPERFWGDAAKDLHWFEEPTQVLDSSNAPLYRWFEGGKFNTCYNAL